MRDWFVVYTQPNGEARAETNLRRQGFEVYLPRHRRKRSHAGRVDVVVRPLFPRYLFVAFDELTARWRSILGTFGVCDLVRSGDTPLPLPTGVVNAIRESEHAGAFDAVDGAFRLRAGELVRLATGPFADLIGRFQSASSADRVLVLLDVLGREVRVQIPAQFVEPA